jgi:Carboxypeptidase regulatory-like domain
MRAERIMRRQIRELLVSALVVVGAGAAAPSSAQINTGSVDGTVRDSTGAVLPGVTVTLASSRVLGGPLMALTDRLGRYRFDGLAPGMCDLDFALAGFKSLTRAGVVVTAAFVATIDVSLEVGAVNEVIEVTDGSPVVDVRSNVQQTVMDQPLLEGLPTGRDPWAVARLIPGIALSAYDVGGSSGMQAGIMSIHGSRVSDVTYGIDGLSVNYPGPSGAASGGTTSIYFDQGLFEQINYQTSALPAEVPAGGIYLNMVTRSGSSRWGGDSRVYLAGERTQTNNFEELSRELGVAVGNPITSQYDVNLTLSGPLARDRLWYFGSYRQWKVDKRLLAVFNPDGTTAVDDNLIWSGSSKVSGQINPGHRLSALAVYSEKNRYHRRDAPPNYIEDKASVLQKASALVGQLKANSVLAAATVLEVGVGGTTGNNPARYQPEVRPTDLRREDPVLSTAAGAARAHSENPFRRLVVDGVVSHTRATAAGSHLIRGGLQYTRQGFEERNVINGDVRLGYQNGVANQVTVFNTPVSARSGLQQLGFFGQDSWLVGRNLTLNLGFRLDRAEGWIPAQSNPGGRFVGTRSIERQDVYDQWIGVWRIGAVYDLSGRGGTAIKASVSRYGQQAGMNLVTSVHPFSLSQATLSWRDANGNGLPESSELGAFEGFTGGATTRYARAGGPDWSYSDEITIGAEHQAARDIRLSAMYLRRMNSLTIGSRNVAAPSSVYTTLTVANPLGGTLPVYNLDPAFLGRQDTVRDNESLLDSNYHGVEIIASRRFSGRWQMLTGFTWSRSTTGIDGDLNDPNNLQFQQGSQLDDLTYQWRASGTYVIPGIELTTSGTFLHNTGIPRQYTLTVTRALVPSLTRASQVVRANRRGEMRRPNVTLFDLRVARTFRFGTRMRVEPQVDVFNVPNAETVLAFGGDVIGPTLNRPSEILAPRLVRVGVVVAF